MSDISERLTVHCPDSEAAGHVAAFVAKHQTGDGTIRIPLRLPAGTFADRRSLAERRVIATLYPLHSTRDPHPTYSVTWAPQGGGAFPEFAGALAVEKGPRDACFGLMVSGHYEPPAVAVGALFDVALGARIVRTVARDLLHTIADHVHNAQAHCAAARAGRGPLTNRGDAAHRAARREYVVDEPPVAGVHGGRR